MDPLLHGSPYLQDPHDFPPSSSSSAQFDISHESPYESFAFEHDFPQDNIHFPHTPSYNGSYANSPYSVLSDLPPTFDNDHTDSLGLFSSDNPSGISITEEYDPSEYDPPNSSGLITFDESFMSGTDAANPHVSITPPAYDESSPAPYDHPSPASSNGGEDDHRSRSSASSYNIQHSSPQLDFTSNFDKLGFDSPSWSASQLPGGNRSPPLQKPQSPPQLVIPDISSPSTTVHDEPPTIIAPDGDGGMPAGPQLHIVPATPISGGGGVTRNVAFLQQGVCRSFVLFCFPALFNCLLVFSVSALPARSTRGSFSYP